MSLEAFEGGSEYNSNDTTNCLRITLLIISTITIIVIIVSSMMIALPIAIMIITMREGPGHAQGEGLFREGEGLLRGVLALLYHIMLFYIKVCCSIV